MLGKLMKHEMKSYRFSMGITFLAGLIFTIFMKVLCILPYRGELKEIVQVFSFYGYYYIIMAIAFAAQILIVVQFYKTTVGDRAYLTWTLPAKSSTILWSKILSGGIWYILSGIVICVLFVLFIAGNYWAGEFNLFSEMVNAIEEASPLIAEAFELKYLVSFCLIIVDMIVWSFTGFLLFYMCIAIGQLFGKWRIVASFGAYFLVIIALQIVMVIVMLVFMGGSAVVLNDVNDIDVFLYVNGLLSGMLLLGAGVFAGLFALTNWIFKKHLNLE